MAFSCNPLTFHEDTLFLSSNKLSGPIPDQVEALTALGRCIQLEEAQGKPYLMSFLIVFFAVDNNNLSGGLPPALGTLSKLCK